MTALRSSRSLCKGSMDEIHIKLKLEEEDDGDTNAFKNENTRTNTRTMTTVDSTETDTNTDTNTDTDIDDNTDHGSSDTPTPTTTTTSTPTITTTITPKATKEIRVMDETVEMNGYKELVNALTPQEINDMSDVNLPLRHLRADKGNISKALSRLKYAIQWRKEYGVQEMLQAAHSHNHNHNQKPTNESESEQTIRNMLLEESASGKIYVRGHDKQGRAILYMRQQRENTHNETNNIQHLVYQIERAIACTERNGYEKFTVIMDFEGWNLSHASSMKVTKDTIHIMQDCYVERVGRVYFANAPGVFRTFYNMVKVFLDPSTKAKILFCPPPPGVGRRRARSVSGGIQLELEKVFDPSTTERCIFGTGGSEGESRLREFDAEEYFNLPLNVSFDERI